MPPTEDTGRADLPLSDDIAEVRREVQVAVNDVKAAEEALAARNARLDEVAAQVAALSPEFAAYINDFRNPATPEPSPIAPEVPPSVVTVETPPVGEGTTAVDGAT